MRYKLVTNLQKNVKVIYWSLSEKIVDLGLSQVSRIQKVQVELFEQYIISIYVYMCSN
jgi:hypothetical protein